MGTVNRAEVIDAHDLLDGRERGLGERFAHADAGVVDQDIDLAEVREDFLDHAMNLFRVADVTGHHRRLRAGLAHFFEHLFQPCDRPAAADDHGAAAGEVDGQLLADAAGRAGDQDDLAIKFHRYQSDDRCTELRLAV